MTFKNYNLVIGNSSIDLFNHYKVDTLHGLNRKSCNEYKDTKEDAYIAGMANEAPDGTKPYVFINNLRLCGNQKDVTLVMHEMMHMSLLLNNWDITNKEEEIITWAENETNKVIEYIWNRY